MASCHPDLNSSYFQTAPQFCLPHIFIPADRSTYLQLHVFQVLALLVYHATLLHVDLKSISGLESWLDDVYVCTGNV